MNNTSGVSQLPIAVAEATADRPRGGGRNGAAVADDGGFRKLVAKLARTQDQAERGDAPPAADARAGESEWRRLTSWLGADATLPAGDAGTELPEGSADQVLPPQQSTDAAQALVLAGTNDIASLMQLLAAGGVLAGGNDPAAIAARFANGTATDADAALVRAALTAQPDQDGPPLPDATMLASLAKAASRAEALRGGKPAPPETIGKVAMLGQERHFAPVPTEAATEAAVAITDMDEPAPDASADSAPVQTAGDAGLDAQLVNPRAAVTALRDARPGPHPQPDGDPMHRQPPQRESLSAPDAAPAVDGPAAGAGQVQAAARPDALVNAGLGAGVTQQIADRIGSEASTLVAQAARPATPGPGAAQPSVSPVKVIYIQLSPAELGTVTIRLAVKDQALQVDLEVGRGETAHLIQRDRETLSAMLRSAGYAIDGMDVRLAGPGGVGAPAPDSQANMQGGGQSRGSQPDGRSQGTESQDDRRGNNFGNGRNREQEQAGRTARGSGLYV